MSYTIDKKEVNESLFKFLKSIYLFENREIKLFNITWDEVYLLQLLIRYSGICVSDISKELRVRKFVASRMIKRLEEVNFVRKESDDNDKRVVKVYITGAGLEKINEIEAYNYETVKKNISKFPKENMHMLLQVISQLDILLDLQDGDKSK